MLCRGRLATKVPTTWRTLTTAVGARVQPFCTLISDADVRWFCDGFGVGTGKRAGAGLSRNYTGVSGSKAGSQQSPALSAELRLTLLHLSDKMVRGGRFLGGDWHFQLRDDFAIAM